MRMWWLRRRLLVMFARPAVVVEWLRVLIVDDELAMRLMAMLERCGAEVLAAGSALEEVWKRSNAGVPDVLVADIGMPVEDGYGLIRKVRALPKERRRANAGAALTAYARTEDRVRAISEGYQLHLAKPVDRVELATVVASLANRTAPAGVDFTYMCSRLRKPIKDF